MHFLIEDTPQIRSSRRRIEAVADLSKEAVLGLDYPLFDYSDILYESVPIYAYSIVLHLCYDVTERQVNMPVRPTERQCCQLPAHTFFHRSDAPAVIVEVLQLTVADHADREGGHGSVAEQFGYLGVLVVFRLHFLRDFQGGADKFSLF